MANVLETNYSGSEGSHVRPETIIHINCLLNAPFIFISITGNLLVLVAILRTPSLRSPSITFLCSLAVSDFLVGIVVQPLYVATELIENSSLKKAMDTMAFTLCGVSLLTMTTISVDRFLALHYHMRYPNLMTEHRAMRTSAMLWFVSLLLGCLTVWNMKVYYFSVLIIIAICVLVSTICYIQIYGIVKQHQLQIHFQQQAVKTATTGHYQIRNNQIGNNQIKNNQIGNIPTGNIQIGKTLKVQRSAKSAKNTFIYYVVMILCYTPVFISMSILAVSSNLWTSAWRLAETAALMNSSINPFLYCWRLRELRKALLNTARQVLCKRTEEM